MEVEDGSERAVVNVSPWQPDLKVNSVKEEISKNLEIIREFVMRTLFTSFFLNIISKS